MTKLQYVKSYEFVDDDFRFTVIELTDSERFELWGRLYDAPVSFMCVSSYAHSLDEFILLAESQLDAHKDFIYNHSFGLEE